MKKYFDSALKILYKVFSENTYSNVALFDRKIDDMTTRLVYGVLEKNIEIEYILNQFITKKPKPIIYVLLKIGTYSLLYLDNVPNFAIVSECVEVCKLNNKQELSGLVNAILKKVANKQYKYPNQNDKNYLTIKYSKPQWFINKLIKEYGLDKTLDILNSKDNYFEHIRVNLNLSNFDEIEKFLIDNGTEYLKSDLNGFYVKPDKSIKELFCEGKITYQAPSSILCVNSIDIKDGDYCLDLCAAPGGKAIYLSERAPSAKIIACDLYPHRVELIKKYIQRMKSKNITPMLSDATIFNKDFTNKFDVVLLDVPCSCLGTFNKHPDVLLNKTEKDIIDISKLQKDIILNAAKYVKKGGILLYSTCTLFKEENREIIDYLLLNFKNYKIILENQILPHDGYDGFYLCKLKNE